MPNDPCNGTVTSSTRPRNGTAAVRYSSRNGTAAASYELSKAFAKAPKRTMMPSRASAQLAVIRNCDSASILRLSQFRITKGSGSYFALFAALH